MPRITFLDNAKEGKNDWWRYLLTIILSIGGPHALSMLIFSIFVIPFFTVLIMFGILTVDDANVITSKPLFGLLIAGIIYVILFSLFYVFIRFIHHKNFISLISTDSKVKWIKIVKGATIWWVILLFTVLLYFIIDPNSIEVTFNANTFVLLVILCLIVFPIQASFEELFYRGYLMQGIGLLTKKPIIPLIITSVIFALIHYGNGNNTLMSVDIVLQVFIYGIAMGIIVLGENRLETAIGVHISNNIFCFVVCMTPGAFGNIPSILTITSTNIIVDVSIAFLSALVLLIIVFWNKKDRIYNIFKTDQNAEINKIKAK